MGEKAVFDKTEKKADKHEEVKKEKEEILLMEKRPMCWYRKIEEE